MAAADNQRVARRFFDDVFNKGDLEAVDEIFADEYVGHSSANLRRPIKGPAGIKRFVQMYRKAFPDIQFEFEDIVTDGDKIAVRWTTVGTHEGELFGIAPSGQRMTVTGIGIAQIVEGKIRASFSEVDMLGMAEQLGVGPKLG
jgi:steroid delta-isomerase-like uncharacterized protein